MPQNTGEPKTKAAWVFPAAVLIAGLMYAYFTFTAPPTEAGQKLGLVGTKLLLLQISFIVPFLAIWLIGSRAAQNLRRYARRVSDASVSNGYRHFAMGITLLVAGQVVAQMIGIPRIFYREDAAVMTALAIIINYVNVLFPLIGLIYFFLAAKQLSVSVEAKSDVGVTSSIIVALLGAMYAFLVFTNPTRQVSSIPDVTPTYYIPDILIVTSIMIPVLATWFFGFRAAFTMGELQHTDSAERKGFPRLLNGIWLILFSSIILQGIISLGGQRFMALGLEWTLVLVYVFLGIIGAGYWFTASGSKKLLG